MQLNTEKVAKMLKSDYVRVGSCVLHVIAAVSGHNYNKNHFSMPYVNYISYLVRSVHMTDYRMIFPINNHGFSF